MTHMENAIPLPPASTRCTEVLTDLLRGYQGVQEVAFDVENGALKLVYDPRRLSPEQAQNLIEQSAIIATQRVMQCLSKQQAGLEACAGCTREMQERLLRYYRAAGESPQVSFREGVIQASLRREEMPAESATATVQALPPAGKVESRLWLAPEKIEMLFTAFNAIFGLSAWLSAKAGGPLWLVALLYTLSYFFGGYFGFLKTLEGLKERVLNVDLLMILAALGAAFIGSPAEGATLLFLFSLSNTLQAYALDRSRKAIQKLLDLRPPVATVRRGSRLEVVPVEALRLGDVVLVRPGERFPIDGEVLQGESDVNQATITGESTPVHKAPGDPVFAATLNGSGALEIRVTRLAQDTMLARIVQMVEEAQATRANTQRALDTFEQYYALFVLSAAALLILIPWLLLGQPFHPTFYRAMTWLVVASPCALVISTPASILSAIANAARNGILFKGGIHLEKTATLKVIAFDKTGTLTTGKPSLQKIYALRGNENELLRLAASIESRSEHPLAHAVVAAAQERGLNVPQAYDFRAIPGQGVEGRVEGEDGDPWFWIGGERLFQERNIPIPSSLQEQARAWEDSGQTVMFVYCAGSEDGKCSPGFLGLLGIADTLREDAIAMIRGLKTIGIERIVMLTGDNPRVAAQIAAQAGVDEFHAALLPQDKVTVLRELRQKYGPTGMVGDGVNDAPSLAVADVGIAMGGAGTDVAIETADVVLMSNDLRKIPFAIQLARQAQRVVRQNLTFALAVIVILVASAFGFNLPLPLGVVGHEGSTVIVVLNGLRLLGYRGIKV